MDPVTLPNIPDIVDEIRREFGVECGNYDGQPMVPAGRGAEIQTWLDDAARAVDAVPRLRAFAKRRIILYAAQQWENTVEDDAEERALARFAGAICAMGAADVALGGTLNGAETSVVQWAHNEMSDLRTWAKNAYDAITRLSSETDPDALWAAGSDPASLPEFQP